MFLERAHIYARLSGSRTICKYCGVALGSDIHSTRVPKAERGDYTVTIECVCKLDTQKALSEMEGSLRSALKDTSASLNPRIGRLAEAARMSHCPSIIELPETIRLRSEIDVALVHMRRALERMRSAAKVSR